MPYPADNGEQAITQGNVHTLHRSDPSSMIIPPTYGHGREILQENSHVRFVGGIIRNPELSLAAMMGFMIKQIGEYFPPSLPARSST
jgi:hypothetical protein